MMERIFAGLLCHFNYVVVYFFVYYFLQLTWQTVLALRCVAHYVHSNSEGGMAGGTAILVISHFFEKSPLLKTRGTLPPAAFVPFSFLVLPHPLPLSPPFPGRLPPRRLWRRVRPRGSLRRRKQRVGRRNPP